MRVKDKGTGRTGKTGSGFLIWYRGTCTGNFGPRYNSVIAFLSAEQALVSTIAHFKRISTSGVIPESVHHKDFLPECFTFIAQLGSITG